MSILQLHARRRASLPVAAILDIGTSKITCMIGQRLENGNVRILGAGVRASEGVQAGNVIDMEQAELAVRSAVEIAEKQAGIAIHSVLVNLSTRSLKSRHIHVETKFNAAEVADRDLQRVIKTALAEFNMSDQAIIHALPLNWTLDGERGIRDPRGMFGKVLGVDMHFVTANIGVLRNLAHLIERCHLRVGGVVASSYAAGGAVLVDDEIDLGVTIIDMGAGVTTASVFRDRALVFVDAIGVGGRNVTSDIAKGISTPWEAAERIKNMYGSALEGPDDDRHNVPCPPMGAQDELFNIPVSELTAIIRARMEETFEILRDRFKQAGIDNYAGRRIVLTGGAAQLSGATQLGEYVFGKRVRLGKPHGIIGLDDTKSGADYAVACGLLKHAFRQNREVISGAPDLSGRRFRERRYQGGMFARSFKWLKENF